jgi:hypothetical protein
MIALGYRTTIPAEKIGGVRHCPRFQFLKNGDSLERKRDRESGKIFSVGASPDKQMLSAYGKVADCTVGAREPKLTI